MQAAQSELIISPESNFNALVWSHVYKTVVNVNVKPMFSYIGLYETT